MLFRRLLVAVASVLLLVRAPFAHSQISKGNQILINRGFQVQGMVNSGDVFHLTTYSNANYTSINWLWASTPSLMGNAPGFPWSRWASSQADMPPVGSEGPYLSQLVTLQLGDEWNLNDDTTRSNLVNWFNAVRASWPNTILYHNNYGGQVSDFQLGDYITRAQPDMLSFDTYPWWFNGQGTSAGDTPIHWYGDLRRYREHARGANIPLACYMQTYYSVTEGTRSPSAPELRLNHFAALAFNVKTLIDFTYNTGASSLFTNSFGGDNAPAPLYYEKMDCAARVRNFGKALVRLKPIGDASYPDLRTTSMMFIRGQDPTGAINPIPIGFVADPEVPNSYTDWAFGRNDPYLVGWSVTNVAAIKNNGNPGDVIVSWFTPLDESFDGPDYTNEVYLMVVNGLTATNGTAADCLQEIKLNFVDAFTTVELLNPLTGSVQAQTLPVVNTRRQLTLNLNGGDAVLFKFFNGAPFVGASVVGPPLIATQPASRTNSAGTDATFSTLVAGSSPLSYQWRFNGTNISGATTNTFTRSSVQLTNAGSYTVVITNSLGSVTSSVAVLTVNVAPQITAHPQSQAVSSGTNVSFSVTATGNPPPVYRWRFNGTNISGATASSYTRTNVQSADAGSYSVLVSNALGSTVSSNAVLTVNGSPSITAQPQNRAVTIGAVASLTVTAVGSPPLAYQWRKDGANLADGGNISGATNATLVLGNVQPADFASYTVVVTNGYGGVTSTPAALLLATTPVIQVQPKSRTNNFSTPALFNVIATGNGLNYQWRRNGTNLADAGTLSGSTSDTLFISAVAGTDAATYTVVITNAAGSVTSAPAQLTFVTAFPVREPFNYPAGANLGGQIGPDNLSWADVGTSTAGPFVTAQSGNLDVPGLAPSSGNSILFGGLGKSARLSLSSPVTTGTMYYSFALSVSDLTGAPSGGGFIAGFNNSSGTQAGQPTVVGTRLYLRSTAGGFNLGVAKNSSTTTDWVWDDTIYNTNQTVFIVGSYTFTTLGNTADDISQLWISPDPSTFGAGSPPAPTLIATTGNDITANQILSFVFFQRGASVEPAAMIADELRIDSTWAGVTPVAAPIITSQPASLTNNPGTPASFSVGASGSGVKYQWYRNGTNLTNGGNISGATTATLTLSSVAQSDAATYSVVLSTGGGAVLSDPASLTVNSPPQISPQPQSQTVPVNGTASFYAFVTGTSPFIYQWRFNGTNISGATDSSYTRTNAQRFDAGSYSVQVTNMAGYATSSNAVLIVTPITPIQLRAATLLSGDRFQFQGSGDPGYFVISGSSNLVNWSDLTNLLSTNGQFEFVDFITNAPQRFYRARLFP